MLKKINYKLNKSIFLRFYNKNQNKFKPLKKFKSLESNPTITLMKTLQTYLFTLHKRNKSKPKKNITR